MGDEIIQTGVVLTFAVEGEETIVASAVAQDGLTASVENYAASATSAYAKASAGQKSLIDAYMQQAAAARASGESIANIRASIQQSIGDLEKYAVAWANGANASLTGSAAAAEAAGILRIQLEELAAAQLKQAAAARAAAAEQAAAAKLATNDAAIQGYLAQADAITTSNTALSLQQAQLQEIAALLGKDVTAFVSLGDAGVTAADASAQALDVVEAALASIAAEQKVVIAGMANIAKASAGASGFIGPIAPAEVRLMQADAIVTSNAALGIQQIELQKIATQLKADTAAFMAMGEEGAASADASAEALKLVQVALASIAAEQRAVIAGMLAMASGGVVPPIPPSTLGAAERLAASLFGVNSQLVAMAKNMLPLAAAFGLVILTKNAIEYEVSLARIHEKLGISTEDLSAFHVAARQNGMDVEDMNRAFTMLAKNIDLALHGAAKPLTNFGELLKMSSDQVKTWGAGGDIKTHMLDVANALDQIPDAETRLAKASELLVRAGGGSGGAANFLNTLHALAGDGFAKAAAAARELGVEVSEKQAEDALRFQQSWERAKLSLMGVGVTITGAVIPAMNSLSSSIDDMERIAPWTKWLTPLNAIAGTIRIISGGIATMLEPIARVSALLGEVITASGNLWGGSGTAELSDYSKAKLAAGKLRSTPGAYSFLDDHDAQARAIHDRYVGYVGAAYGVDGGSGMPGTIFDPNYKRPGLDEDAAKQKAQDILQISKDQLDIAQQQYRVASAHNIAESQRAEYGLKILEINKQLDTEIRSIDKNKDLDAEQKAQAIALDRAAAQAKINAAAAQYSTQVKETTRSESEIVISLGNQLAIQSLKTAASGGASAMMKEQLSYAEKQLQIENDLAAEKRKITAPGPNSLPAAEQQKQIAQQEAIAEQKSLAATLDHLAAVRQVAMAEATVTRELTLAADAEARNVQLSRNAFEIQLINQNAIQTTADIQRAADLEKQNALLKLADSRAQIDEAERKAIDEQNLILAAQATKWRMGMPIDDAAIEAALARIKALQDKFNSANVAAAIQAQTTINASEFQSIQQKNAALAEARYSNAIMDVQQAANTARVIAKALGDPMMAAFAEMFDAIADGMKKVADRTNEIWRTVGDNISQGFSTLFQTLSRGGGLSTAFKDMGQQFESSFGNIIEKRINTWATELSRMAQGLPGLDANGKPLPAFDALNNPINRPTADQQSGAQFGLGALTAAQAGVGAFSAGTGHGQATTSAISAGIAGAMTGNPWIAVAAVIASEIGSALATQQRQSEYLYGVPTFTNGKASISGERNINAQKSQELTAQLQDSFNTAWNGFVTVMGKLGGNVPGMPSFMGGQFQPNPSANWEKHFQQYLTDTLPLAIAGMFKDGMQKSFVSSGLTSEAFDKFWTEAAALDPTKRMQFWQDLADGIVSFAHAQKTFESVKNLNGDYTGAKFDANGNSIYGMDNDFMAALRTGAKQVFDIARDMVSMTGPDRIAAFKQMGASVDQIATSFAQFIQQVGASLKAVKQSFSDTYLQHDLAAAGEVRDANGNIIHQNDPNAQARLLENAYNQNQFQIDHASQLGLNPQDIERLTQQSIGYLNQIFALNPTAEADAWWHKQMAALQSSSEAALKLMGDAATDEMGKFLDSIKPFKDYMLGLPVEIDPSIIALEAQFDGLAAAVAALTVSIKNSTPPANSNPGGGSPGDGGPYIPNPDDGLVKTNSVTEGSGTGGTAINVYLNGTFVDTISFQEAIYNGVSLAVRENPSKFAPLF